MGKEIRYILLSFSVVLAIFVFAFLWQVRPGYEDEVLAKARERQNEQLVNVPEPLDTDAGAVKESMDADDVAEALLADPDFIGSVASQVEASVPGYIEQYAEAYIADLPEDFIGGIADRVVEYAIANQEAVLQAIDARTRAVVEDVLAEKEAVYAGYINDTILSTIEQGRAGLEADILVAVQNRMDAVISDAEVVLDQRIADAVATAMPEVEAMISAAIDDAVAVYGPQVEDMISAAIGEAVATYEPQVQSMIDSSIVAAEDDAIAYVDANIDAFADSVAQTVALNLMQASGRKTGDTDYDRIVYQVSSDIVGAIGAQDAKTVSGLDSYKENTYAAIENIVLEVINRLEAKYGASVSVSSQSLPAVVEAPSTQVEVKQDLISRPSFDFSSSSAGVSPEDYKADRDEVRRAEIRRVLDGLID